MNTRTKLNVTDRQFSVIEKEKVVRCKITVDFQLAPLMNDTIGKTISEDMATVIMKSIEKKFPKFKYGYIVFTAKARCRKGDVFDVEKGMRIAEYKAKVKMYNMAKRAYLEAYNTVCKVVDRLQDLTLAIDITEKHESDYLNSVINEDFNK